MSINFELSQRWDPRIVKMVEKEYGGTFICETSIKYKDLWRMEPSLIFYNDTPHPHGSNYLAVSIDSINNCVLSDGISVVGIDIYGKVADDGEIIYSRYRHDYRSSKDNSVFIDGGRDYRRCSVHGNNVILRIIQDKLQIVSGLDEQLLKI